MPILGVDVLRYWPYDLYCCNYSSSCIVIKNSAFVYHSPPLTFAFLLCDQIHYQDGSAQSFTQCYELSIHFVKCPCLRIHLNVSGYPSSMTIYPILDLAVALSISTVSGHQFPLKLASHHNSIPSIHTLVLVFIRYRPIRDIARL